MDQMNKSFFDRFIEGFANTKLERRVKVVAFISFLLIILSLASGAYFLTRTHNSPSGEVTPYWQLLLESNQDQND